jgi:SWIM zinc finger
LHDFSFSALSFDESDIRRCLPGSFEKGRPYQRQGAVRDLRADKGGQRLIASVKGTRVRPYHVFVDIEDSEPISLKARCSCPVGWNCKHAAAVLIEALRNPPAVAPAEEDPLSGPVGGWLDQLRAAARSAGSPEAIAYRLDLSPQPGSSFVLDLRVVRILKSGEWGADRALPSTQLQNPTANYLAPGDRAIIRLLQGGSWSSLMHLPEDGEVADLAMRRILATGRCRWQSLASPPLTLGPGRGGRLA